MVTLHTRTRYDRLILRPNQRYWKTPIKSKFLLSFIELHYVLALSFN